MIKIAYTVYPSQPLSLPEWLAEFRCGISIIRKNDRALDIMKTWTYDEKPVDWKKFIDKKSIDWS